MTFAAATALASAFNLICSGTAWHSSGLLEPRENVRQFEYIYHVDLAAGRYCAGPCTTTSQIKQVTENLIIFDMEERDKLDDTLVYVNRENGKYWDRVRRFLPPSSVLVDMAEGSCERAPFTGFPATKF